MAVGLGHGNHLGRDVFGQTMIEAGGVGMQHLAHADNLGCGLRRSGGRSARNQHMHVATAGQRGGHGVEGGALDGRVVMVGYDEG